MREPFYWAKRKAWYVRTADGKSQTKLHEDKKRAFEIWHERQALARPDSPAVILAVIAEQYIRHGVGGLSDKQRRHVCEKLANFCNVCGTKPVCDLKTFDLTSWLDSHPTWGDWARRGAAAAIKRALNWAVEQGLIPSSPLDKAKMPEGGRRETMISDDQHAQLMTRVPLDRKKKPRRPSKTELAFRQVMIAMRLTGARPGTVAAVARENVTPAADAWVMRRHKTAKKIKKPITVYLSPCMQTLTRILLSRPRSGPLFVNSRGKPWTTSALGQRMQRLRKWLKLPAGTVCYSHRHTYITTALTEGGASLSTVAELVGHANVRMIAMHYAHLEQQKSHLRQAANQAIPLPKPSPDSQTAARE